jgi:hypothetical protein
MIRHGDIPPGQLGPMIRSGEIGLGGNAKLMIYGRLDCKSGMRMLTEHRVLFRDEAEAIAAGYRPCGNCLYADYRVWKSRHGGG